MPGGAVKDIIEEFGLARTAPVDYRPVYCDCGEPTPGWWGLECSACRRLIEGTVQAGIARRDAHQSC